MTEMVLNSRKTVFIRAVAALLGGIALLLLTIWLNTMLAMPAFGQVKPAVQLEGAIAREQVDGDLKAAIAAYQKISADSGAPRDVRGKALLHLAGCYEKLGQQQSREVYERILRDFWDQPAAGQARKRLAALKQEGHDEETLPVSVIQRKIEMPSLPMEASHTDGRHVVYLDKATGHLIYGDLAGKSKRIISKKKPDDFCPSRDFSMVVLRFRQPNAGEMFSVVKTDGTGYRELATLGGENLCDGGWSWDNRSLVLRHHQDGSRSMLRLSLADGQVHELFNVKGGNAWAGRFSPNGHFIAYQASPTLLNDPVGRIFVMPAEGGDTQLVYEERHSSQVFKSQNSVRLLDWSADGRFLVFGSERSGKGALYLAPVRDGRSAGDPVFVKYGDFEAGSTTTSGELIYKSEKPGGVWTVYLASLSADNHPNGWERLDLRLGNLLNPEPRFSSDGREITYVAMNSDAGQVGGRAVHLRNLITKEDREVFRGAGMVDCVWAAGQPKLFCIDAGEKTEVFSVGLESGEISRLYTFSTPRYLLIDQLSRDGRALYLSEVSNNGLETLRWEIATGQETRLGTAASFDSDSGQAVYFPESPWFVRYAKNNLEIRATSGGDWRPLVSLVSPKFLMASLTPDGRWLLYLDIDSTGKQGMFRVATGGGDPERLTAPPIDAKNGNFEISANGSKIMLAASDYDNRFELWSLANFVPSSTRGKK